jgi:hypothetical protein
VRVEEEAAFRDLQLALAELDGQAPHGVFLPHGTDTMFPSWMRSAISAPQDRYSNAIFTTNRRLAVTSRTAARELPVER